MMDYLRYWSLFEKPFGREASRHFFYGPPQREAIARIHCTISGGMSCAVLASAAGCGMSHFLRHVARTSGFGDCAVEMLLIKGGFANAMDVYRQLAKTLRISASSSKLENDVRAAISATGRQAVRTVLLIDGVNEAAARVARTLMDSDEWLTVIAGTSPEKVKSVAVEFGTCPLRIDLGPLGLDDTGKFLQESLRTAGCSRLVFADSAVVRIHEMSCGQMKPLCQLAELSLLVGASSGHDPVTADLLDAIHDELVQAA